MAKPLGVRLAGWLIGIPLAVIVILFAVSNRAAVDLNLWPLPFVMNAPLYLIVLLGVLVGFLGGALVAWIAGHGARARASRSERELRHVKADLSRVERRLESASAEATTAARSMVAAQND